MSKAGRNEVAFTQISPDGKTKRVVAKTGRPKMASKFSILNRALGRIQS